MCVVNCDRSFSTPEKKSIYIKAEDKINGKKFEGDFAYKGFCSWKDVIHCQLFEGMTPADVTKKGLNR